MVPNLRIAFCYQPDQTRRTFQQQFCPLHNSYMQFLCSFAASLPQLQKAAPYCMSPFTQPVQYLVGLPFMISILQNYQTLRIQSSLKPMCANVAPQGQYFV